MYNTTKYQEMLQDMMNPNGGGNPAEQHVDAAQRAQAMEFLQKIMMAKQQDGGYTPIVKSLNNLGVSFKTLRVPIYNEDGTDVECICIPADELMRKEWEHMNQVTEIANKLGGMQ